MKKGQRLWTREELIVTINLYCKLPFGKLHHRHPEVVKLAELLGRTPGSIAYKLVNFASLDPSLQSRGIKGASNTSKLDRAIWDEFYQNWDALPYESEKLRADLEGTSVEVLNELSIGDIPESKERETIVKQRVNQSFFRKAVLASYDYSCCITGISHNALLVAGHISTWAADPANRMNPSNGLAMNALHDKAYEHGLMAIAQDYTIHVASDLLGDTTPHLHAFFKQFEGKQIKLPKRFLPDRDLLEKHYSERFKH